MFKHILKKFFQNRLSFIFTFIIMLTFLITSISPYLTGAFVDFLVINKDEKKVIFLAALIMSVGIIGILLAYVKNMMSVKITSQVSFNLLQDITKYLKRVKLEIIETKDPMYLAQQISTDVNVTTGFVISNYITIFLNLFLAVGIVYLFCSINLILLIMMISLIIPYIILYIKMRGPLYQKFLEKKDADSKFFSKLSSQICQIFFIKTY